MQKTLAPGAIGVKGLTLAETIDLAAASGFDSIVFDIREAERLADADGVDAVRSLFARAGVQPGYWGLPVAWRDDEKSAADLEALPKRAALARDLGCTRVTTGVMPGSNDLTFDENYAFVVERLRPPAQILADAGCRLGIEFIAPKTLRSTFKHEFIYNLPQTMELATTIGTGNVGLLLDAWHLYTSHGTNADIEGVSADDVVVVHVNDAPPGIPIDEQQDLVRALPLETGVLDIVGFMHALQRIGYDGPVMPEPFSKRLEELGASDPLAAAREAGRSMDALWMAAGLG
ncbi:MAG TPA: sugar phosphate isomerase/epimerase family protein [Thermomicrobiales bacterium]|nr:sugar phosphate isomerase/epimerase family protein [Thermomicrobiales bacterium]